MNKEFSVDDFVAGVTKKARAFFLLKTIFRDSYSSISLPPFKAFIRPHVEYAIQASSSILCRNSKA